MHNIKKRKNEKGHEGNGKETEDDDRSELFKMHTANYFAAHSGAAVKRKIKFFKVEFERES